MSFPQLSAAGRGKQKTEGESKQPTPYELFLHHNDYTGECLFHATLFLVMFS